MPDPLPPPPWLKEEETGEKTLLDELVGQTVVDTGSGTQGTLKTRTDRRTGQRVYWLSGAGGEAFNLGASPTLMNPSTLQLYTLTPAGTVMSGGKASQFQLEQFGFVEPSGDGAAYHPPAWKPGELALEQAGLQLDKDRLNAEIADTEAQLAWDKEQFAIAEANADSRLMKQLKADMDMLLIRLDNSRRELMVTEGGAMARTLVQEKGAMKRELLRLGPDPFKQMSGLFGGPQRGITPQQTAVGQAQSFINQPIPQVHFGMTNPQMQAALGTLQGTQAPQFGGFGLAPGAFGMAGGGKVGDGPFGPKQSWLIGEGKHGEGLAMGTAEVLTVEKGPFGIKSVEVTPLAGMAQGGMSLGDPWEQRRRMEEQLRAAQNAFSPWPQPAFSPEQISMLGGLAPLYSGLGLGGIPTINRGPAGEMFGTGWPGTETLSTLGIRPQLVRDVMTTNVFLIEDGTHRYISPEAWEASGFQRSDIINLSHEDVLRLAPVRGPDVSVGFPVEIPSNIGFGAQKTPFIEPFTGAIMPSPHKIAGTLGNLQRTLGEELFGSNVLGAFSSAGMFPSQVLAQMEAFTPQSRGGYAGWNPQRIGWRGTQY